MKCSRPFTQGVAEFGCGQCSPCRLNRRRLWTARIMLEARKHDFSAFVTLTFDKEHYVESVSPKELQVFLKKFRKVCWPTKIRFYAVGEYGDRRGRPHYHLCLFGLPTGELDKISQLVLTAWDKGGVHVGTLTSGSAAYVASYTTKGWTKKDDVRLKGKHPEFARMSLRPGIGATYIDDFGASIREGIDVSTGEYYGLPDGDVPSVFISDGSRLPLGRYLRQRLRLAAGMAKPEPVATGELRNYRRFVDLRAAGLSGWRVREARRLQSEWNAKGFIQRSADRKGIWL